MKSFRKYWVDFVIAFLMPKVIHLSTLIIILDHWHQMEKRFKRCWFSDSWPVITAASSGNWNQWIGFNSLKEKPNWWYFSALICWMKVLKHILKRRGLRQSPCNTTRPTDIKGVRNSEVIIEVWKSVYKLFITNFM